MAGLFSHGFHHIYIHTYTIIYIYNIYTICIYNICYILYVLHIKELPVKEIRITIPFIIASKIFRHKVNQGSKRIVH